jgi:hypothetical protein
MNFPSKAIEFVVPGELTFDSVGFVVIGELTVEQAWKGIIRTNNQEIKGNFFMIASFKLMIFF